MLTSLSASTHVRKRTSPIQEPVQNQPPSKKVQAGPSLDLSTEDEMIDLGAEDPKNSENSDPNIQAGPNKGSTSKKGQKQKIKPPPSAAFLQTTSLDEEETGNVLKNPN